MGRSIGHNSSPGYKPGDRWSECDLCGFDFRVKELRVDWEGRLVCSADFEQRHPQELLRANPETSVTQPEKSRAEDKAGPLDGSAPTGGAAFVAVTFEETTTVPSGTFNNEL